MEMEKLEEAQKTFEEDCERFKKYTIEMDAMAERAKDSTESAVKQKQ